jgi:hypothetical protein
VRFHSKPIEDQVAFGGGKSAVPGRVVEVGRDTACVLAVRVFDVICTALVVSRKMIFLFAAIYCTLVKRHGFIVTLYRTLV